MEQIERVAGFGWYVRDDRVHRVAKLDSANTLVGFDLIVWDVDGTLPTSAFARTSDLYAGDIARRRDEIQQHLAAGRPLVVFLPSADQRIGDAWVPGSLLPFELELVGARGTHMEIVDPLVAPLFDWEWDESEPCFESYMPDPPGRPLVRIARSDRVVGAFVQVNAAPVALLPRFDPRNFYDDDATALLDQLIALIDGTSPQAASLPAWSNDVVLPDEPRVVARLARDRETIARAELRVRRGEQRLAAVRRRKLLFTADGPPLERIAAEAFAALGFEVTPGERGRADLLLRLGARVAVVEVKGKRASASERDASQVAKWVFGEHADHGRRAKGILLVNGFKDRPLAARDAVFPDQMLRFAQQQELCLVTGVQLLTMWLLAERDARARARLARLLMSTVGPIAGYEDPAAT